MEVLNRYYLTTEFEDVWWLAALAVVVACVGGVCGAIGMYAQCCLLLLISVLLCIAYVLLGSIFGVPTDVEVLECVFASQEDIDNALLDYELIEVRGVIHVLIRKEPD